MNAQGHDLHSEEGKGDDEDCIRKPLRGAVYEREDWCEVPLFEAAATEKRRNVSNKEGRTKPHKRLAIENNAI